MTSYADPDTWTRDVGPVRPSHSIAWGLVLLGVGIVVMAITAFFHLIDEGEAISYGWLALPVLMGGLAAWVVGRDRRLVPARRVLWSIGLFTTGLAALAVALVLIYEVLPFGH